jgi:hypothetical protein
MIGQRKCQLNYILIWLVKVNVSLFMIGQRKGKFKKYEKNESKLCVK